ncbi:hypothetical protein EDC01DRAFT_680955 [Geopyxis carbonaria]|nr:hypothetical protein EDC01DRAFT_680955 [Geopyxis carbonaria]
MKFSLVLAAVFVGAATAQMGLPKCVNECLPQNIAKSGCKNPSDLKCICSSKDFIDAMTDCMITKCDKDELNQALTDAESQCEAIGAPSFPSSAVDKVKAAQDSTTTTVATTTTSAATTTTSSEASTSTSTSTGTSTSTTTATSTNAAPVETMAIGLGAVGMGLGLLFNIAL